jgi:hypothetical protein
MSKTHETTGRGVPFGLQYAVLLAAASGLATATANPGCASTLTHIPLWQIYESANSDLCFVGNPPTSGGTTTITTPLVPIKLELVDAKGKIVVLDPILPLSVPVNSLPGFNAFDAVLASPIFENHNWTVGSTDLGTVQWGEAVERASFWKYPGTNFTNWHLQMTTPIVAEKTIAVPPGLWSPSTKTPGAYQVEEAVLKPWLDFFALSYALTEPHAVPIFLTYNVEKSNGSSCCARGYHSHVVDTKGYTIPYIWASYMDASASSPNPDLNALSHEVAEFMLNPVNNNTVNPGWPSANSFPLLAKPPYWKPPYTFTSGNCDSSFEDGDPIEDRPKITRLFTITTPTMTYNFQNVATASWLMRVSSSFSVNKQYAFPNTPDGEFSAPAPVCPGKVP